MLSALPMSFCPRRTWKNYSIYKEDLSMRIFNKKDTQKKATTKPVSYTHLDVYKRHALLPATV